MSDNGQILKDIAEIKSVLQILLDMVGNQRKVEQSGERVAELIEHYGYIVNKRTAAQILGVNRVTVYAMLKDGRLKGACDGTKVDVRSIAAYIECPSRPRSGKEIYMGNGGDAR